MNIYLISQTKNKNYDSYDSAVVVAESEYEACIIHPGGKKMRVDSGGYFISTQESDCKFDWVTNPDDVSVELIAENVVGVHQYVTIICASYNAG